MCIARFWNHQNDKKFGQVLVKLQTLAQKDEYGTIRTRGVKSRPPDFYDVTCIFRIWRHLKSHAFQGTCLNWCSSTRIIRMSNTHKLFFTSSQNSTFSLKTNFRNTWNIPLIYGITNHFWFCKMILRDICIGLTSLIQLLQRSFVSSIEICVTFFHVLSLGNWRGCSLRSQSSQSLPVSPLL